MTINFTIHRNFYKLDLVQAEKNFKFILNVTNKRLKLFNSDGEWRDTSPIQVTLQKDNHGKEIIAIKPDHFDNEEN